MATVQRLIEMLRQYRPDTRVIAWDADSERIEEVTGLLHSPNHNTVRIETDEL